MLAKSNLFQPWTVEEQKKLEELLVQYPQEAIEFHRYKKIAAQLGKVYTNPRSEATAFFKESEEGLLANQLILPVSKLKTFILENRTVYQVTSRLQKYFLKLYKAGLPIPGPPPKTSERNKVGNII